MLVNQLHERLQSLRLQGMSSALEIQQSNAELQAMDFIERLGLLIDAEIQQREQRKYERLFKQAKLKHGSACPEDIDYRKKRELEKSVVANLLNGDWVDRFQNLIITGPTGGGKTWLACAIAQQMIRKCYVVKYFRLVRLLEDFEVARGDGSLPKLRNQLAKAQLIILDDWGVAALKVKQRHDLFELIEDCNGSCSIIITAQLPIEKWHDYIGEPTIADAILDRIVHNAHRIKLKGDSMRKRNNIKGAKHV